MDFKNIFELCKNYFGEKVRYIKKLGDDTYEVHECHKNTKIIYIMKIRDGKIKVLEEQEVSEK